LLIPVEITLAPRPAAIRGAELEGGAVDPHPMHDDASLCASATFARLAPRRLAICIAQALRARRIIEARRQHYNRERPLSAPARSATSRAGAVRAPDRCAWTR
jgi:hypothetical protein